MPCRIRTVDRGLRTGEAVPVQINANVPGRRGPAGAERQLRVPLGYLVATRAVDRQLMGHAAGRAFVMSCLRRHQSGDWGDLGSHDAEANDLALVTGARVLSSYLIPQKVRQGAGAAQDRAAGNSLLGDDHDSALRIRKGVLLTMPETRDDQVMSSAADSRLICRTTGMS